MRWGPRSEEAERGRGEQGEKQSRAGGGEAGAGSSPAGGEALASLSHSLAARRETQSPVISPPRRSLAPPRAPLRSPKRE